MPNEAPHSEDPSVSECEPFNPLPYSVSDCLDFVVDVVGAKHIFGPAYNATHEIHSKDYDVLEDTEHHTRGFGLTSKVAENTSDSSGALCENSTPDNPGVQKSLQI